MESGKKGLAWHNQTKRIGLVPFHFFAGDGASCMDKRPIRRKTEAVRQLAEGQQTNVQRSDDEARPTEDIRWLLSCKLTWTDSSLESYAYHPHISEPIH